jgi:hypothetical protein
MSSKAGNSSTFLLPWKLNLFLEETSVRNSSTSAARMMGDILKGKKGTQIQVLACYMVALCLGGTHNS